MEDQSSKVVYGILSRLQIMVRSVCYCQCNQYQYPLISKPAAYVRTVALFGEEQVCLAGGRDIRYPIPSIEEDRAVRLGDCSIRANLQGLVMAKVAVCT